ncbi:putative leucine-rich repeat receptor-like protein kinase [Dorcoceras hygrometricum]|uniref:Putative leucine-rich repeat receptor-like protein kinase n=1 Tax=Dorcoceras hygrometricum TaxID=472368 RepID=A0A2Z7CG95_9LAMI|nr:putative leucine-rich repeat receptor-like protein kinase [Dorcoceras hygrometricum]
MPPRRGGGRRTRRSEEESRAGSDDDAQVEDVTRQIGGMELVLARFQRTNPPTLADTEGGARAEAWLVQMEELFDTLEYAPEKRLKLAVLQLRDDAQRWWRSTSRMLRDSGTMLTWDVFCEAFRRLRRGLFRWRSCLIPWSMLQKRD